MVLDIDGSKFNESTRIYPWTTGHFSFGVDKPNEPITPRCLHYDNTGYYSDTPCGRNLNAFFCDISELCTTNKYLTFCTGFDYTWYEAESFCTSTFGTHLAKWKFS